MDLVSTRDGTDVQSARCARLLASVIAQAIKDAAVTPFGEEKKRRRNAGNSFRAIQFLFEPQGVFDVYASLIGSSGDDIRRALLNRHRLHPGHRTLFSDRDRRVIQLRYHWYRNDKNPLRELRAEIEEEEEHEG